ncbi:hypothetical protein Gotur_030113 [Gossypium turneri]
MMVAKATFDNVDAGARRSILGILSDSHMEVEGVKPAALNGNNRNQGSYEEILGKDLLAREKLWFNPKIKTKVFKKRPKKNKGKSVISVNGPKANSNVLKPINKTETISGQLEGFLYNVGKLLTDEERARQVMTQFSYCELCGSIEESAIHAIRDCGFAQTVWKFVLPRRAWGSFFNLPFERWVIRNIQNEGAIGQWSYTNMTEKRWQVPASGWVKFNVDGSAWVVLKGLKLAWDQGFRKVELESDDALLIEAIQNGLVAVSNVDEVKMIHNYCSKAWQVKFRHIQCTEEEEDVVEGSSACHSRQKTSRTKKTLAFRQAKLLRIREFSSEPCGENTVVFEHKGEM